MAGNVWEWTSSKYQSYPGAAQTIDYTSKDYRMIRGESWWWNNWPMAYRCAHRSFTTPVARVNTLGFRVARDN